MNENEDMELLELEAELSALRPRKVQPVLLEKVERALAAQQGCARGSLPIAAETGNGATAFFARYGQLAAAALLVLSSALLYWISRDDGTGTAPVSAVADNANRDSSPAVSAGAGAGAPGWQPVGTTSRLTRPSDGGVIIEEGQPFRVLQYQLEEEQRYTNPKDGSSIKVQRPRTEQMRIPLHVL